MIIGLDLDQDKIKSELDRCITTDQELHNIGSRIGIMKKGALVHESSTADITTQELQKLHLKTI